jgi:signal transduction histidine kinase
VHSAVRRVELGLVLIGAIVLALGLGAGIVIAAQIARPLGRLERVAKSVAEGDLSARATLEGSREQRSLSASFNEMTDRLQRMMDSQRAFVADASHQLRTPLTGLRLRVEEARAAVGGQPAAELDAGLSEVDRLAHIVEELLVLSRAGERELPGEAVDLSDLAEGTLSRWHGAARERGVSLAPGDLVGGTAWCARGDAELALDALVENGVRYSPAGATVTISTGPGTVEVADRGPGLTEEDGQAVFERFHRGSAGRSGPSGTGLGLAIARELVGAWGGTVSLRNRDGGGAVATLTLPERKGPFASA